MSKAIENPDGGTFFAYNYICITSILLKRKAVGPEELDTANTAVARTGTGSTTTACWSKMVCFCQQNSMFRHTASPDTITPAPTCNSLPKCHLSRDERNHPD